MSETFDQLLDAAIDHLDALKRRGVRHVAVAPETLAALNKPLPPRPAAQPAKTVPPKGFPRSTEPAQPMLAAATPLSTLLKPEAKLAAMERLRERALACVKCAHLASSRKNVVFGVGNIDAHLMFVGEAPGADEDVQGEPFVGRAGELLTKIIKAMGLSREDVYIANILKCRPDTPGQTSGNRPPTPQEMDTCIPFLHEQIDLIRPKVLVALGNTAIGGLLKNLPKVMGLRGKWHTYRSIPLMPTYHPAFLLRNQSMTDRRKVWEDMLQVMEKLEMPISERQRNFFLPGR